MKKQKAIGVGDRVRFSDGYLRILGEKPGNAISAQRGVVAKKRSLPGRWVYVVRWDEGHEQTMESGQLARAED